MMTSFWKYQLASSTEQASTGHRGKKKITQCTCDSRHWPDTPTPAPLTWCQGPAWMVHLRCVHGVREGGKGLLFSEGLPFLIRVCEYVLHHIQCHYCGKKVKWKWIFSVTSNYWYTCVTFYFYFQLLRFQLSLCWVAPIIFIVFLDVCLLFTSPYRTTMVLVISVGVIQVCVCVFVCVSLSLNQHTRQVYLSRWFITKHDNGWSEHIDST